jgi:Uma2 family endonuclease
MPQVSEQPREKFPTPFPIVWTRTDCAEFIEQGRLTPGDYELIEGVIIRKMGQKRPHIASVTRLFAWCVSVFGTAFVQSQAPIDVAPLDNPTNAPEPDVTVMNRADSQFITDDPGPADLVLVGEVSDATLAFDLTTKAGLYARAGIVEYWVVDVNGRAVIIHREPNVEAGRYQNVVRYAADESIATLARPSVAVAVSDLLPPLSSVPLTP